MNKVVSTGDLMLAGHEVRLSRAQKYLMGCTFINALKNESNFVWFLTKLRFQNNKAFLAGIRSARKMHESGFVWS